MCHACLFRNDIDLEGRLEYLSRAIMSAKSCNVRPSSISDGEFLHELEEKLEVTYVLQYNGSVTTVLF
jgi:nuclear pore complex protein Nup155